MTTPVEEKAVAKRLAKNHEKDRDTYRKRAYAEHRLIVATDRYITARTTASKEKAHNWIAAWHAFRTSHRR